MSNESSGNWLRDHLDSVPPPSAEIRSRVWDRVIVGGDRHQKIPRLPRATSRRVAAVVVSLAVLGAAGTGVAAASGAFQSQANTAFSKAAAIHRTENKATARRSNGAPPATAVPPTTVASGNPEVRDGSLVVSETASNGLAMQVWVTPQVGGGTCYATVLGTPGKGLPGKPAASTQERCESELPNTLSDLSGQLWISNSGSRYMILTGYAPSTSVVSVRFICQGAVTTTTLVSRQWYAAAVPYKSFNAGCSLEGLSRDSKVVARFKYA